MATLKLRCSIRSKGACIGLESIITVQAKSQFEFSGTVAVASRVSPSELPHQGRTFPVIQRNRRRYFRQFIINPQSGSHSPARQIHGGHRLQKVHELPESSGTDTEAIGSCSMNIVRTLFGTMWVRVCLG